MRLHLAPAALVACAIVLGTGAARAEDLDETKGDPNDVTGARFALGIQTVMHNGAENVGAQPGPVMSLVIRAPKLEVDVTMRASLVPNGGSASGTFAAGAGVRFFVKTWDSGDKAFFLATGLDALAAHVDGREAFAPAFRMGLGIDLFHSDVHGRLSLDLTASLPVLELTRGSSSNGRYTAFPTFMVRYTF